MKVPADKRPTGLGLGLRWAFFDEILAGDIPLPVTFFEIAPENYLQRGGYFPQGLLEIAEKKPLLTHGLTLNIGSSEAPDPVYLSQLKAFLDSLGVRHHSDHLCWTGYHRRCFHDLLPLPLTPQVAQHVADQIMRVQDALERPLTLENISYYASPGFAQNAGSSLAKVELDFIYEILERANSSLLLDVNNVWVNAQNHDFDPYDFLAQIPLERVVQLHIAGGEYKTQFSNLLIDTHGTAVPKQVKSLMEWVIERTGALPVLYERDNNIPPLADLSLELEQLDAAYQAAFFRFQQANPPSTAQTSTRRQQSFEQISLSSISLEEHQRLWATLLCSAKDNLQEVLPAEHASTILQPLPSESQTLEQFAVDRVWIYRDLIQTSLRQVIQNFIPRTIARLGEQAFLLWFMKWLKESGPLSYLFREIPRNFVDWVSPQWLANPQTPDYLVDLANHELLAAEVEAAPTSPDGKDPHPFVLDQPLRFANSVRLARYHYPIHELSESLTDTQTPPQQNTSLLVYRDPEHEVCYLKLSELADTVLHELLIERRTVADAIQTSLRILGEQPDETILTRLSELFHNLAQRHVIY